MFSDFILTRRSLRSLWTSGAFLAFVALALPDRAQTSLSLAVDPDSETVKLDSFVVTDANSLKTTLPVRPVSAVYGFDTPYQDIPRSITQINPQVPPELEKILSR